MATKIIKKSLPETGLTIYARIEQLATGKFFNQNNNLFENYDEAKRADLAEDTGNQKRSYSFIGGDAEIWSDGQYQITLYEQVNGAPDDDNDIPRADGVMHIGNDAEITLDLLTRVLGLLGTNSISDEEDYDPNGKMKSAIIRIYNTKVNAEAHVRGSGDQTGMIYKYKTIANVPSGNTKDMLRTEEQ